MQQAGCPAASVSSSSSSTSIHGVSSEASSILAAALATGCQQRVQRRPKTGCKKEYDTKKKRKATWPANGRHHEQRTRSRVPATSPAAAVRVAGCHQPAEGNDTASRLSDGEREEQGASCKSSGGRASSRVPATGRRQRYSK